MVSPKGKMDGRSPVEQFLKKVQEAAEFVFRWKWTSREVLDSVNGTDRRGLATKMIDAGLLRATKTAGGGILPNVPHHILTLTQSGVDLVERYRMNNDVMENRLIFQYDAKQYSRSQANFAHDHWAQKLSLQFMRERRIGSFTTPLELKALAAEDGIVRAKHFDCVWFSYGARDYIGIEIELTQKYSDTLDRFVGGCLGEIASGRVKAVIIVSDMSEIISNYRQAFAAGNEYRTFKRHKISNKWVCMGNETIHEEVAAKIGFILLSPTDGEHKFQGAAEMLLKTFIR